MDTAISVKNLNEPQQGANEGSPGEVSPAGATRLWVKEDAAEIAGMEITLPFSKYAGSGNDFICIDNRAGSVPVYSPAAFSRLCDRKRGIGADGLILLETSSRADYKMRIFNADGGEAEMCGNGARCLYKFMHEIGLTQPIYFIETQKSMIRLRGEGSAVCVSMPEPCDARRPITLPLNDTPWVFHYINTGVPHVVCFVTNLQDNQWMDMAPQIRFHRHFQPAGVNVNFVEIDALQRLHIRTYERGVEAETLSCGTGATAAALIAAQCYGLSSPITLVPRSNENLKVHFQNSPEGFRLVELYGPAEWIFRGIATLHAEW